MPNWCANKLTVTGAKEDLQNFKEKVVHKDPAKNVRKTEVLSFGTTVPRPPEFDEGDKWYNWNIENWGTKWDASNPILSEETDEQLIYHFDTAWSPPEPWLAETAPQFPKLNFRLYYNEGGMNFAGYVCYEQGDRADEEQYDSWVEGDIAEYGHADACCEACSGENQLTRDWRHDVCQDCAVNRCKNCKEHKDEHNAGKCLYQPTTFEAWGTGDDDVEVAEEAVHP